MALLLRLEDVVALDCVHMVEREEDLNLLVEELLKFFECERAHLNDLGSYFAILMRTVVRVEWEKAS
jgi:hypothetical protein